MTTQVEHRTTIWTDSRAAAIRQFANLEADGWRFHGSAIICGPFSGQPDAFRFDFSRTRTDAGGCLEETWTSLYLQARGLSWEEQPRLQTMWRPGPGDAWQPLEEPLPIPLARRGENQRSSVAARLRRQVQAHQVSQQLTLFF